MALNQERMGATGMGVTDNVFKLLAWHTAVSGP